jgi:hypothetical protein
MLRFSLLFSKKIMKVAILPALTIVMLSLVSCKKTYTCACTSTYSVTTSSGSSVVTNSGYYDDGGGAYGKKMNKKTAQAACDAEKASFEKAMMNTYTNNGSEPLDANESLSTECTLK